jgi:hypothetical protein
MSVLLFVLRYSSIPNDVTEPSDGLRYRNRITMTKTIMRYWLPAFIWALLIFVGSSIPGHDIPGPISVASTGFHVGEYFVLAALIARACTAPSEPMKKWQAAFAALAIAVCFAVTDEAHQALVPGREVDVNDFIADAAGAGGGALGWLFFLSMSVWKKRKNIV